MEKKDERICFIYNPSSGRNRAGRQLKQIKYKAEELWRNPEFLVTRKESDIMEFAQKAAGSYDVVIGCGGDGTINQVINGIAGSEVSFGVLPLGSGNDFGKANNIPKDPFKALDIIYYGREKSIDLIRCNGNTETWCANTLGIGLDGWANYYASKFQILRGRLIYIIGVLKAVYYFRGCKMVLTVDHKLIDREFLMVTLCNGPEEGGGFKVAPSASNSDGLIDLLTIDKMSMIRILWYLPKFLFRSEKKLKGVNRIKCKKVILKTDEPLAVHSDGQNLGTDIKTLTAVLHHRILKVIVP
jgi:diacylglycerol kinase (ATP)